MSDAIYTVPTVTNHLFSLTFDLDPVREVNRSRKLCSNPKRFDSRIVQPITVQLISTLGWPNVCKAPTATIDRNNRDPLVVGCDLDVRGVACEEGRLHKAHKGVQNEGGERNTRDVRIRDRGAEKGHLRVW